MKQFTLSRFSRIEDLPPPPPVPGPSDGRYQPVLGTVAYDDINKRMNVTTMTGANGKASGRLKSYKFREGTQQFDVTLPVGADGDFICMVTHATDPAMTNGIGVGLQSDGAGNWNLATLSGTKVTVGASSGLTDGMTARIEIEKDITGAYWYYIYDATGTKPTTPTGKLFTTLTEGYTGWYANGNNKTYAIENISSRAESIVGRTNVEVTEPFWFRDEFGEDSLGRYARTGISYDGENNECYVWGRSGIYITDHPTFIGETIVTIQTRNTGVTTDCYPCVVFGEPKKIYGGGTTDNFINGNPTLCVRFSTDGVDVFQNGVAVPGATSTAIKYQSGETQTFVVTYNGNNQITVSDGTNSITFTDDAFAVRTVFSAFVGTYSTTAASGVENRFKLIEISGTRVYNKPIHRGAMLETYHDGTQEVVGTTFIDDCQWDRSAEYSVTANRFVWDSTNGVIKPVASGTEMSGQVIFKVPVGSAHYHAKFKVTDVSYYTCTVFWCDSSLVPDHIPIDHVTSTKNLYFVTYNGKTKYFELKRKLANTIANNVAVYAQVVNVGDIVVYDIIHDVSNGSIRVYINGVLRITASDSTFTSGYFGIADIYTVGSPFELQEFWVIAASPDATNGIAACIPPIGGGARYGVEESVYNTFTTANVDKGVYLAAAKTKTTNPNADEASLKFINETDSTTLSLERTETEKSLTLNADYTVLTESLNIDDEETDILSVGVKNSTICNQPATYVESLSLIPVSGNSVLYPQDLAFISGVKPSQKRKVEVK